MSWHTEYTRAAGPGRRATPVIESAATTDSGADGTVGQVAAEGRAGEFLAMSVLLTGYGRVQLAGTGQTSAYLRAIDAALPVGVLDDLLGAVARLLARSTSSGDALEADLAAAILDDPRLGPVARNIILLWYCGTWTALSEDWHAAYGASPRDATRVLSGRAYQAGLQWTAAGAHPAGARQQGFAAWSVPPQAGSTEPAPAEPTLPESALAEGSGA